MGKIKSLEIIFADGKTVYHPGEVVRGKCVLELRGDLKLKSLRMFMRGKAKVHWSESVGSGEDARTRHYSAEVEYISKEQLLFGNEIGSKLSTLNEGRKEFNFNFDLPTGGVCTSFEGKDGSIRYWLKADLSKPWMFNLKVKKAFTVINPIDINKPEFQVPVEKSVEKTLCCWFCRSGLISLSARTDRRGYCPGESVAIWADFSNQSSRTLVPYVTLNQTQTFFAKGDSRVRTSKCSALTGAHIKGHDRATWDGQLLEIPAVSPSVSDCSIIRVEYFIKVSLHIPGAYNLSMHLPIIVGTEPYRRSAPLYVSSHMPILLSLGGREATLVPYDSSTPPPPYRENGSLSRPDQGSWDVREERESKFVTVIQPSKHTWT